MKISYHKQQTDYTCGAASLRMALQACGIRKSEKQASKLLSTKKVKGSSNEDFPKVAEKFLLNYQVKRNAEIKDLKECLKQGYAIIVGYYYIPEHFGHYAVLKKIDSKCIYFLDPLFGPNCKYSLRYFKEFWRNSPKGDNEKRWFFAVKKA